MRINSHDAIISLVLGNANLVKSLNAVFNECNRRFSSDSACRTRKIVFTAALVTVTSTSLSLMEFVLTVAISSVLEIVFAVTTEVGVDAMDAHDSDAAAMIRSATQSTTGSKEWKLEMSRCRCMEWIP